MKQGLTQLYIGEGKGKTTAALGQAIRACGRDMKVLFVQFLKSTPSGELKVLGEKLSGIEVKRFNSQKKFIWNMNDEEKALLKQESRDGLNECREYIQSGIYDMVVLDELLNCLRNGFFSEEEICSLIAGKSAGTELVLTGREAGDMVISSSDLVSSIQCVKHPFEQGIEARPGIEY